jgi:hypothetical protein
MFQFLHARLRRGGLFDDIVALVSKHEIYHVAVARAVYTALDALAASWFFLIALQAGGKRRKRK